MAYFFILFLLVLFIVGIIIFKIVKKIILTMLILFVLFISFIGILSYFIYNDIQNLQNIGDQGIKLFYQQNGEIVTGIDIKNNIQNYKTYSNEEIITINKAYKTNDFNSILGGGHSFIVLNEDLINNFLIKPITVGDITIDKEQFFSIMGSDDPIQELFDSEVSQIEREIFFNKLGNKDNAYLKAIILVGVLNEIDLGSPERMIISYKEGNLIIYPETITLKLVKELPIERFI